MGTELISRTWAASPCQSMDQALSVFSWAHVVAYTRSTSLPADELDRPAARNEWGPCAGSEARTERVLVRLSKESRWRKCVLNVPVRRCRTRGQAPSLCCAANNVCEGAWQLIFETRCPSSALSLSSSSSAAKRSRNQNSKVEILRLRGRQVERALNSRATYVTDCLTDICGLPALRTRDAFQSTQSPTTYFSVLRRFQAVALLGL